METSSIDFLKRLVAAIGPSGFEQPAARAWREEAEGFADEVNVDVLGNSFAWLRRPEAPVVVIEGHIDEIGFLITHVDEQGYLWFDNIGGWDAPVVIGQRVLIQSRGDVVSGVIGRKAAHIIKREDNGKNLELRHLWIDIGAQDRAKAEARVSVGDPVVIDAPFRQITDDLMVSRAMDNRVGAFVALEATRLLAEQRPEVEVVAIAATQEETTFAGALTASFQTRPVVAIAIDVTHATDYPGADKHRDGEVSLGGGPVLTRGGSINPIVFERLRVTGERLGFTCPVQGAARTSGTDADAMIRSGAGVATGLVSIPNRYMHSPNELVSQRDVHQAAVLIADFVHGIEPNADFRPF